MNFRKIKLLGFAILSCGLATTSYAILPGPYLGFQVGMTNTHGKSITGNTGIPTGSPTKSTGPGFRGYFGGDFNDYTGMDMGYTVYNNTIYSVNGVNSETHTSALDIVGKVKYTLPWGGIGGYVKGGIAVMVVTYSPSLGIKHQVLPRPIIGLGFTYDITQKVSIDFSASRIFSHGSSTTAVQNADLISLGLSYHFVNEMCGQFIC